MPDEPDPPRKFYEFKPKAFEAVNPPAGTPAAGKGLTVHDHLQSATGRHPPAPPRDAPAGGNDVHAILRDNLARANAAGLNEVADRPVRRSRRKRDYWIAMIVGNAFFGLAALLGAGGRSPMMFVSGIAGMALLSASLTWVMWHLVDDY